MLTCSQQLTSGFAPHSAPSEWQIVTALALSRWREDATLRPVLHSPHIAQRSIQISPEVRDGLDTHA
jgi:hypothetical protein